MAIHERVWERAPSRRERPEHWQPRMTYTLLGIIAGVYVLEWIVALTLGGGAFAYIFTIDFEVWLKPWSLITSTLSHAIVDAHGGVYLWHLLFNALFLFFFGPPLERIWGARKFVTWFFIGGALSGMLQVTISHFFGAGQGALGASGALMMVFGVLVILMPKQKILIWGILPMPFWGAAIGFVALDLLGIVNPNDPVGRFAHLSGMALGLWLGLQTKKDLRRRGLELVY